jgi:serine/threonine protein kinase
MRISRYTEEVALQLAQLHKLGQLHNDVRPGNIFLNEPGAAQLGPPAPSNATEPIDDLEAISDQVDCFAPECALNGRRVDARADIYSLGCTLYFLLTGQPTFPHGTIAERLLMHPSAKPQAIIQFRPEAPARRYLRTNDGEKAVRPVSKRRGSGDGNCSLASRHRYAWLARTLAANCLA